MADRPNCSRCAAVVPWFSLWGNLGLAIYKLVVGLLGNSAALVADALHSFADVIGSTGILVATRVSAREPDARYPYGRGKAEFIGAAFVYTVLLFFAAGIAIGAIQAMLANNPEPPQFFTALGALFSVLYNYLMYKYATCVGRRNNSPAILADAFENRADAVSSAACIVGIVSALLIHPICDAIAALVVGLVIFWNCQEQLREAARGLLDGGMPVAQLGRLREAILATDGVRAIGYLRTRQTGARFWLDVGIQVDSELPVSEADAIGAAVRAAVERSPLCHHVEIYVLPIEHTQLPDGSVFNPATP
jgi:cation diffusion facilitator family transporter